MGLRARDDVACAGVRARPRRPRGSRRGHAAASGTGRAPPGRGRGPRGSRQGRRGEASRGARGRPRGAPLGSRQGRARGGTKGAGGRPQRARRGASREGARGAALGARREDTWGKKEGEGEWKRERERGGSCCAVKNWMRRKGEKGGWARTHGEGQGARGARTKAGPSWVRPGWAGLDRTAVQNPAARTTTDRRPNAKRNPQRDKTNARLNTTSDKRNMLRYDATPMTT
jgi:hypothetical protein